LDPVAGDGDAPPLPPNAHLRRGLADAIPYGDGAFDVIVSRCVLEHLRHPRRVLAEVCRVLKPGGHVLMLTAAKWDYVSVMARLIPNFLHGAIVRLTEGRREADTFPTYYRANTRRAISRAAAACGLDVCEARYLNNYPSNFMFSPALCRAMIAYDSAIGRFRALHWLRGWLMAHLTKPADRRQPAQAPIARCCIEVSGK
jgi:SAM-dependent methyltransferase